MLFSQKLAVFKGKVLASQNMNNPELIQPLLLWPNQTHMVVLNSQIARYVIGLSVVFITFSHQSQVHSVKTVVVLFILHLHITLVNSIYVMSRKSEP